MGEFSNVISYSCLAFNQTISLPNSPPIQATYYPLKMSNDAAQSDITRVLESTAVIFTKLDAGEFILSEVGTYFFNLGFTFSGSASANYKIRAVLNEEPLEQSEITFTTRGTNVRWEVGMTFLVKCGYKPNPLINNGLYSSVNEIKIEYQNVGGTNNLNIVNGIYNVMKID